MTDHGPAAPDPGQGRADASHAGAILVVDNEPMVARTLAMLLRREGYEVDTADNGTTALAKLQERAYDLILCDWVMPVLDGLGLYREVKRQYPRLAARFIVLTGFWEDPETRRLLEENRIPYLRKPLGRAEIRRAVHEALRTGPGSGGSRTWRPRP